MVESDKICCSPLLIQIFWQYRGHLQRCRALHQKLKTGTLSFGIISLSRIFFFPDARQYSHVLTLCHNVGRWNLITETGQLCMCNSPDRNDRLMQRLLATTLFTLCNLNTHFSNQLYWRKVGVTSLQQTEILLIYISPTENIIQLITNVPLSVASHRHVTNVPNYSSINEDGTYTASKLFSFCHF